MDSQNTQQKDAAQFNSLPDGNIQTPHHWQWQKKDEDVENQVADPIPSEKCDQVHTVVSKILVPVTRERRAA